MHPAAVLFVVFVGVAVVVAGHETTVVTLDELEPCMAVFYGRDLGSKLEPGQLSKSGGSMGIVVSVVRSQGFVELWNGPHQPHLDTELHKIPVFRVPVDLVASHIGWVTQAVGEIVWMPALPIELHRLCPIVRVSH